MAKKLISVWLSLTILLFSSISIYAGDNVQGDFYFRDITINGQQINNYHMENPVFLYQNTTYLPLDAEMCEILGIKAELDLESRTLKLWKADSTRTNLSQAWLKNNGEDVKTDMLAQVKVIAYEEASRQTTDTTDKDVKEAEKKPDAADAASADEGEAPQSEEGVESEGEPVIEAPDLNVVQIDLKGLPILVRNKVPYIPVTVIAENDLFKWDIYYDSYTGIYISTKAGISAKSFFNEPESRYNKGLVSYVQKYNGSYTVNKAQELVFIFKHEAEVYNMDVTLLMSVARKESTFNASARSGAGAIGMMQIMPSTAARYGISATQLYDPHVNIEFGTMYLSERMAAYNGNAVVALSSYNQGATAISRGGYSTRYASNVLETKSSMEYYLKASGYGLGN